MTKSNLLTELFKFGILTAIFALALPDLSWAQNNNNTDLNSLITNTSKEQLVNLPYILGVVAYIIGSFMMVSGALKLKAHAENPAEKLAPGIARLLGGAAIISVPALTSFMTKTAGIGGDAPTFIGLSPAF